MEFWTGGVVGEGFRCAAGGIERGKGCDVALLVWFCCQLRKVKRGSGGMKLGEAVSARCRFVGC